MPTRRFGCPVELALGVLGGKWRMVVLARLKQRPHRYAELRASIPQLSDKVLTQRLRELVDAGLVVQDKQGRRGAPSRYRLSPRGQQLRPVLAALYAWGVAEGVRSGVSFDAGPGSSSVAPSEAGSTQGPPTSPPVTGSAPRVRPRAAARDASSRG